MNSIAHAIRKYSKIFGIGVSDMLAWRFGFFLMTLGAVISWAVLLLFWTAVYREGNQIGTFTLQQLVLYYSFGMVFVVVFDYSFIWDIASALHEGRLSEYLVKPVSYLNFQFMREAGARTAVLLAFSVPFLGIIYYFRHSIPHDPRIWLWIAGTLFFGYVLTALFGFLAALGSVFFKNSHTTCSLFFSLSAILSGRIIPISVMPHWLATIARATPFPFVSGVPIEFVIGTRTALTSHELILISSWLIILLILCNSLWRLAAIKYEASGN
ncbi:MAG: ABC-2 family transporter protein [Candidatus Magasanikbacteria bacterium]|nr:ABC-2 family transporter protein [Candidatus Magasanikbacteria bacterium]